MPTTLGEALRDMNRRPGGYILVDAKGAQYNSADLARDLAPAVLQVAVVWGIDNPTTEEGYVYNVSPSGMDFDHPWFLFHPVNLFGGRTLAPDEAVALAQFALTLDEVRARYEDYGQMLVHARALTGDLAALEGMPVLEHGDHRIAGNTARTWDAWHTRMQTLTALLQAAFEEMADTRERLWNNLSDVRDRTKTVQQVIAEEVEHAREQNG